MALKLADEMRAALQKQDGNAVTVEDEQSQRLYVIVDRQLHERAMSALEKVEEDRAAIHDGIAQMEAGDGIPLAEADREIRQELGYSPIVPFNDGIAKTIDWMRQNPPEQIPEELVSYKDQDLALAKIQ